MEAVSVPIQADVLRQLYPRVLAKTLGLTRTLPDAEDAVHDALERALRAWPQSGTPDSPEAWLVTVAANSYRDRMRRGRREELREDALETLAQMSPWVRIAVGEPEVARGWKDELLRLLFACCHPALDDGESAALALSTVVGLSTSEIASAFVVAPRSMEQRLTRARQRLRERGDCEGATPDDSHERVAAVLRAIHLLFNEGYWSTHDEAPIRAELCRLAIGLARSLLEAFPTAAEAAGLLSLLLLHDARRGARLDSRSEPVPLPEQDRGRWDHAAIAAATLLLERTLAAAQPGPFQIEAAIAAVHCRAHCAADTDWPEIAALYALLETFRPAPAVRVNRAFALARADGPAAGLALIDATDITGASSYPYVHLVRGTLLAELGRIEEARQALERAEEHARNAHEGRQIRLKIAQLEAADEGGTP
jgi:RNA polymerase sigma-70 factor (ECF subfamily)